MPDEVIEFLNSFQLGSGMQLIVGFAVVFSSAYAIYRKTTNRIKSIGSKEALDKIEEKKNNEKLEGLQKDVEKLQTDVNDLDSKLNTFKKEVSDSIDKLALDVTNCNEQADNLHTVSIEGLKSLSTKVHNFESSIEKIEDKLVDVTDNINVLMDADLSTHKAFIISEYQRCVKEAKEIDLISLQNIESIYKKYLAEDKNGGDEFITSLVREIRNLPTHK